MEIINATDGYKLGHHRMYPKVLNKFIVTGLLESYEILKYVVDEIKLNQQGNQ
jgi:hypothetical protein